MRTEILKGKPAIGVERLWLLVFLLVAWSVFWPARHAGFVTDWLGGQERYETGMFFQAFHSFGWVAILPVLFTINLALFKLFGTFWLPWFLIFTGLHGLNGWYFYRFVSRIMRGSVASPNSQWLAPAIGGLFLLSPYAVEPIVWKGCIQYPLSLLLLLISLLKVHDFMEKPHWRNILWVHGIFFTSIFLTEWNIIVPAILSLLILVKTAERGDWRKLLQRLRMMVLPQLILLIGWFSLNKFYLGHWVGHYGSATHLQLRPAAMFGTEMKYFVKYLGFARYTDHYKERLFGLFDQPAVLLISALVLIVLIGCWAWLFKKLSVRWRWSGFGLLAFFVALLPVSNLYFYWLQWSENDRYGYYASGFFWMFLILVLLGLPRFIFRGVTIALLAVSLFFQVKMTVLWGQAEDIYASLVRDFRWYDRDEVIILASPDNLKGVSILRIIGQQSGFDEALALRLHHPYTGKMWEVAQFNMEKPTDGVLVERDSSGLLLKTGFRQDGNWWWRNSIGAGDYSNERYTFTMKEWTVETLLKEKHPNTAIIYPVAGRWLEVPQ